jgi:glycosyltransferase involved in cell wall biosynthesis
MSEHPLFTLVTVTYNSSRWVKEAIDSVLASSCRDFEYLIADDSSQDESWDIIAQYNDPRIQCWRNETNLGEYVNRNLALERSAGKYILFVDGDDVLYHHTLRNLKEYIEFFPSAVSIWGTSIRQLSTIPYPQLLKPEEIISLIYLSTINVAHIGLAETVFKTDMLKKLGGFATEFVSGDTFLKKRVAMQGDILLVPMGLVYWRQSAGQASASLQRSLAGMVNNVLIDRKILAEIASKNLPMEVEQAKTNTRIRDIKLLFKHTFLKGNIIRGLQLWKRLGFSLADLGYLFRSGKFTYLRELEQRSRVSEFHFQQAYSGLSDHEDFTRT